MNRKNYLVAVDCMINYLKEVDTSYEYKHRLVDVVLTSFSVVYEQSRYVQKINYLAKLWRYLAKSYISLQVYFMFLTNGRIIICLMTYLKQY